MLIFIKILIVQRKIVNRNGSIHLNIGRFELLQLLFVKQTFSHFTSTLASALSAVFLRQVYKSFCLQAIFYELIFRVMLFSVYFVLISSSFTFARHHIASKVFVETRCTKLTQALHCSRYSFLHLFYALCKRCSFWDFFLRCITLKCIFTSIFFRRKETMELRLKANNDQIT